MVFHQASDFAYSPDPHNGNAGLDRMNYERESKLKTAPARREPPCKPKPNQGGSPNAPPPNKQKEVMIEPSEGATRK